MVLSTVGWPGVLSAKRSSRFLYSIHSFCCANAACAISSTHAAATSRNLCIDPILRPLPSAHRQLVEYLRSNFASEVILPESYRSSRLPIDLPVGADLKGRRYNGGVQHASDDAVFVVQRQGGGGGELL